MHYVLIYLNWPTLPEAMRAISRLIFNAGFTKAQDEKHNWLSKIQSHTAGFEVMSKTQALRFL